MVESSLVLWGDRVISTSVGKPAEVEFNFDAVWRYRAQSPQVFKQKELTWLHVHPVGYGCQASAMDQNCAEGLQVAFGNIGWFGIICFDDADPDDTCADIAWYRMVGNKLSLQERALKPRGSHNRPWTPHRVDNWFGEYSGLTHIPYMLKALSTSR